MASKPSNTALSPGLARQTRRSRTWRRRLGRLDDAPTAYELALELTLQEFERRFIGRRLAGLSLD
jgi:predicted RNA polymerase sigma factor